MKRLERAINLSLIFVSFLLLICNSSVFSQTNSFPADGNVGVGTSNPFGRLHVYQYQQDQTGLVVQGYTINPDLLPHYIALTLDGDYGNQTGNYSQIRSYSNLYSYWGSKLSFHTTSSLQASTLEERMVIDSKGDVGIGTSNPQEKLSVNGKIRAKEVKVEASNWPDYVFKPDYRLPSLAETENHIKDKGHLPGLPDVNEVEKNGIELGEMNKILLKKIEELTLYLIQKDKQLSKEQKINKSQEKRLRVLEQNNKGR